MLLVIGSKIYYCGTHASNPVSPLSTREVENSQKGASYTCLSADIPFTFKFNLRCWTFYQAYNVLGGIFIDPVWDDYDNL